MSDHVTVTPGTAQQVAVFDVVRNRATPTGIDLVPAGEATRVNISATIRGGQTLIGWVMPARYGRVYFNLVPAEGAPATPRDVVQAVDARIPPE